MGFLQQRNAQRVPQTLRIHVHPQKWLSLAGIPLFLLQIKKAQRPMKHGEFIPWRPGKARDSHCAQ